MAGINWLLKEHFVLQNYSLLPRSAEAPMPMWCIKVSEHKSFMTKRPHVVLWGVKTGISLNYYYVEGKSCMCSTAEIILKLKRKRKAELIRLLWKNENKKNKKGTRYCCSNQHSASYMAHRAAAFAVSTTQSHQWTEQPSGPERRWINEQTYCWQELNTTVAAGWSAAREKPKATIYLGLLYFSNGNVTMHISPRWENASLGYKTGALLPEMDALRV